MVTQKPPPLKKGEGYTLCVENYGKHLLGLSMPLHSPIY
jgi:hypothetical protein